MKSICQSFSLKLLTPLDLKWNIFHLFIIDGSKIEAEVKSDTDSKILEHLPQREVIEKLANDLLDMQVGETDMKVRHVLTKSVEVCVYILSSSEPTDSHLKMQK